MLRRLSVTFVAFGLLATVLVSKTAAITGNFVPDFTHPYVGLIALYDDNGEYVGRCSGTLLSPTIVLTAAHCLSPARAVASARIWFHQDAGSQFDPLTELDVHTGYPDYCVPDDPLCVESHTLIPMTVFPDENTQR